MKNPKYKILQSKYNVLVFEYLQYFDKKQGVITQYSELSEWVDFADCIMSFSDIRFDIDNAIPKGKIIDYFWESVEKYETNKPAPNYRNWCKMQNNFKAIR